MSLNDWKEDGQPKQMGDQEKPLNDGAAAESQQDVDFWDHNQNGVVENEVEVVADAVEIQEAVEGQDVVEHPEMPSEKNEKKVKRKKDKAKKKKNKAEDLNAPDLLGTNKGVETMFRNAVRSEMELLALAATKANIMISLNGFIVSALMISGAFIFSSSPEFLIPASTFMITAAASIVFALLSASPERIGKMQAARTWLKDFVRGRSKLRDLKTRLSSTETRFFGGSQPNILIYEDRVKLQKDQYWEMMQEIMGDRKQIYQKMSDHLYWLGLLADKQFKYINLSYAVFRWGLLASLAAFIGVKTLPSLLTPPANNAAELRSLGINMFNGVFEPSAVQQLPDGKLLIAEDEPNHAFSIISIDKTGRFVEDEALDTRVITGFKRRLSDLEALARDDEGFIYALTSHSRTRKGNRSPDREHLMRFKIQDGNVLGLTSYDNLTQVLETDHKLHDLIRERTKAEVSFEEINIEGMAFDPVKKRLVLGFRDPEFNNIWGRYYFDTFIDKAKKGEIFKENKILNKNSGKIGFDTFRLKLVESNLTLIPFLHDFDEVLG